MFLLLVSFFIAIAIGTLITLTFLPAKERSMRGLVFGLCAGSGLGLGVTSCLYFVVLLVGQRRYFVLIEIMAAALLVLLWPALIRKKIRPAASPDGPRQGAGRDMHKILYGVFGVAVVSSLISLVLSFLKDPHGKWDAWLIWNTHARFIFRGGEAWRDLFTSGLDWTHLDYPLMLPLSVVRAWQYAGYESLYAPMAVSLVFVCATVGLLYASLAVLRSTGQGLLGGLALMGGPFFLILGAYQVADIPLAFFILTTLVVFIIYDRFSEQNGRTLVLAGLAAGLAAWTKNEGLLFLLVAPAVRFAVVARARNAASAGKEIPWFLAGAVPVAIVLAIFKIALAPSNDIFAGQSLQDMASRLADPSRYFEILKAWFLTGFTFTQGILNIQTGLRFNPGAVGLLLLTVYMIFMGVHVRAQDRPGVYTAAVALLATAGGFFAVYLITPQNLHWHLTTSLNRLLMQLWPGFLFWFFMAARTPEEKDVGRVFSAAKTETGAAASRGRKRKAAKQKGSKETGL